MGYRRESICSYCLNCGHTRRNCPSTPEHIKKHYAERAKNRRCNYCANVGHNRSSCESRKNALARFKKNEILRRNAINAFYKKHGFGVGAVVSYEVPPWMRNRNYDMTEENVYDTLTIYECRAPYCEGVVMFNVHSASRNSKHAASIATLEMIGEWGSVSIPWIDCDGLQHSLSFYPDHKVSMLIPADENAKMLEDKLLHDINTVTSIPDNIADTVRSKKE